MAADPISIVTSILFLLFDIKRILDRLGSNNQQCHEIGTLIDILQAIVKGLPPGAEKNEGISLALKHLKETLEQSRRAVDSCAVKKNLLLRAIEANHTAEDLGRVCEIISGQVSAMKLAVSVFNSSILVDILKKFDDNQRQFHQLEQLLAQHSYRNNPTECATDQNRQERLIEKTDGVARSEVTNEKDNLPAADIKLGISGVP